MAEQVQSPINSDPWEEDFRREHANFCRLLPSLLASHAGEFVAIRDGEAIDFDSSEAELAWRVCSKWPDKYVLVRQVVPEEPVVEMRSPVRDFP